MGGPSSLWKTLRSIALQGRAPINANTGVSAMGRGVRGDEIGQRASGDLGSPGQPESRTPIGDDANTPAKAALD
jgi:hypothetical protein